MYYIKYSQMSQFLSKNHEINLETQSQHMVDDSAIIVNFIFLLVFDKSEIFLFLLKN